MSKNRRGMSRSTPKKTLDLPIHVAASAGPGAAENTSGRGRVSLSLTIPLMRSVGSSFVVRLGLLGLLGLLGAVPVLAQGAASAPLVKEDLGHGIYLFRASSNLDYWTATNSVVIVDEDGVTVFDSCTRASTARLVIAEIRKLTSEPVRALINSHWHMDHWSGNAEYAKAFPGVRIIATEETRDYMSRMTARFFADEVGLDRARARLADAIRTGKLDDGSPLTDATRHEKEASIADAAKFVAELDATPRVLPNVVYRDRLTLWNGRRELRLLSATGDATGSTILFLPAERLLVTGDVLVSPENGQGPPPWTTNSYAIAPWLASLRMLEALDASVIVPGQGPAMHDAAYLSRTAALFAAIVGQVHAALERGLVTLSEVQAAVNVDSIGVGYTSGASTPSPQFHRLVATLVKKALQESVDGAANLN